MITVISAYVCLYVNIFATKIKAYKSIHLMKSDLNERRDVMVCGTKRERSDVYKSFLVVCSTSNIGSPGKRLRLAPLTDLHNKVLITCESFAVSLRTAIQRSFLQNTEHNDAREIVVGKQYFRYSNFFRFHSTQTELNFQQFKLR